MAQEFIEFFIPEAVRGVSLSAVAEKLVGVLAIYVLAKLAIKMILRAVRRADRAVGSYDISTHTYKLMGNLVSTGVYFIAVLTVFWMFGLLPAVYTLLTAAGFVGIVLGFGLKDVLSNFVSGMILAVEQPFKIGDEIEVKGFGGRVEDVSIRMTTIKLWDGRLVFIPNSMMINTPVINLNRGGKRQVEASLKFDSGEDLGGVVEKIRGVFEADDFVLDKPAPAVIVSEINPKDFKLLIRFWFDVESTNYQDVKADVMQKIKKTLA